MDGVEREMVFSGFAFICSLLVYSIFMCAICVSIKYGKYLHWD
jgi:hypothetical protein